MNGKKGQGACQTHFLIDHILQFGKHSQIFFPGLNGKKRDEILPLDLSGRQYKAMLNYTDGRTI